ncbi:unnamed protein product [Menidia menidia]|uniref:(Atlantic silverside) hypothetical protein n=1 Tax=Menidia menidia TaxID=238744 RepID=A0A8S4AYX2_9TELE|nr:unnamed protein product [Menidia menidia]
MYVAIMDLRGALVIICLCALAITFTDAGIPKCCISIRPVNLKKLPKIVRWEMQHSYGVCDIDALKVYIVGRSKPICAHPSLKNQLEKRMVKVQRLHQLKSKRN